MNILQKITIKYTKQITYKYNKAVQKENFYFRNIFLYIQTNNYINYMF